MKTSRRKMIRYGAGLTTIAAGLFFPAVRAAYSPGEIDRRLARGRNLAGLSKDDLPTPSLVLDLDILESNIAKMSLYAKAASIALRPHAKTHKCVEIAKRQLKAGALGVCVATIGEAEAMASGGIRGLLITSEMVGRDKIGRLIRLTKKQSDTMSVVDHSKHAEQLNEAAAVAKVRLNVLIDVDPGGRRTGVAPGASAIELTQHAAKLPNLNVRGFHCYSGASSHVAGFDARRSHSEQAMAPAIETFFQLRKAGLPLEVFSGGSTGTYNIDPEFKALTELQVGSYAVMDVDYHNIGGKGSSTYDDFGRALTVIATVISKSHPDRATVDAGFKAFATDRRFGPEPKAVTGVKYQFGGDEHGILDVQDSIREIQLGDRLEFIVPHCDPNVNLYSRIHCVRGDRIEAVWPVVGTY